MAFRGVAGRSFGFSGDGQTPNDKIMKYYLKYYDRTPLYFPAGIYCFEETIDFPKAIYIHMDPKAELKCVAEEPLDFFITVRKDASDWCELDGYARAYIRGGMINCNYKAKTGLAVSQCYQPKFEGFMIKNVLEKGIVTWYNTNNLKDGAFVGRDLVIYNDKALPGTYGIYDPHADTNVYGTSIVNFETAIYTHGGRFYECTAWNTKTDCLKNASFAEVAKGTQTLFDNCSIDTVRYGFKIADGASCQIMNMTWITNNVFYTAKLQMEYPRTIFYCQKPAKARVYAVNLSIPAESCLDFSNGPMPNSIFLNTRVPEGFNTSKMKYFRNDTANLGK